MRRIVLILLTLIMTGALGYIFNVSSLVNSQSIAYSLSSGWSSNNQCSHSPSTSCVPQNICIAPVKAPVKGVPLKLQRANLSTCQLQRNVIAEVVDWAIDAIITILIVWGLIAQLVWKAHKNPLYA